MKKHLQRGASWGVALLLLVFADEILGWFNVSAAARPYVISAASCLWLVLPLSWSGVQTIRRSWPEKGPQLWRALQAPWDQEVRLLIGLLVGVELVVSLVATYNIEGSLLLKATQFTLSIVIVNVLLMTLWILFGTEQQKAAESTTSTAAKA